MWWNRLLGRRRASAPQALPVRPREQPLNAYVFSSPLTLSDMHSLLGQSTPWSWREGDNGWVGDYLAAIVSPPDGSLRLYGEGRRFVIEMRRSAFNDTIRRQLLEQILPLLRAEDVLPNLGFD